MWKARDSPIFPKKLNHLEALFPFYFNILRALYVFRSVLHHISHSILQSLWNLNRTWAELWVVMVKQTFFSLFEKETNFLSTNITSHAKNLKYHISSALSSASCHMSAHIRCYNYTRRAFLPYFCTLFVGVRKHFHFNFRFPVHFSIWSTEHIQIRWRCPHACRVW